MEWKGKEERRKERRGRETRGEERNGGSEVESKAECAAK